MMDRAADGLAPVRGKARIDILDILRGLAILGILFINVPYMAAPVWKFTTGDIRAIGWSPADQLAWGAVEVLAAGTQRCLLQFLFGAGMMILARKAMEPDGPVAVADLYYRRNLWLLGFGLVDVFVLLWPGDILHIYAFAALFLFPFRRLPPRALVTIGLVWAALVAAGIPDNGVRGYVDRVQLSHAVDAAQQHVREGVALSADEHRALVRWDMLSHQNRNPETLHHEAAEYRAHAGKLISYVERAWDLWGLWTQEWLVWNVLEAFCTMLIGVALWKWGVIQGERSTRFYLALLVACYGFGIPARLLGLGEVLSLTPVPRTIWITGEFARLAIGLGHLALVHLLVRTAVGAALLAPIKAVGRMAFSLYFLQQFIGMYVLFAPFGFNLWGRFGWAAMAGISVAMIVLEIILANLWLRWFTNGPLEWLWRSLAYVKIQPILRARAPHSRSGALAIS